MLQLDDLAMFVTIADHNNISSAARHLNVPKATLSRRLADYEKRIGKTLFVRSTRVLQLTEEGRKLYQMSKTTIDNALQLVSSIRLPEDKVVGTVSISATNAIGEYLLLPVINEIKTKYPNIKIALKLSETRLKLIEEEIDIAIRMGQLEDSDLLARPLTKIRRMLVASPKYLSEYGPITNIQQLSSRPAIVQNKLSAHLSFTHSEEVQLNWSLATNNLSMMKRIILEGSELGLLPDFMIKAELERGELIEILPNHTLPFAPASIVTPRRAFRSPAIQVVLEEMHRYFENA